MSIQNNRPILHLTATINNTPYLIGTLRFFNEQISYFFSDPIEAPKVQLNLKTRDSISRRHHITFHTNQMHTRYADRSIKPIEVFPYANGPLFLEQPILTPLYVESIYFDKKPCLMKLSDFSAWKKGSQSQNILTLDISSGFSLIFILAPASLSTPEILNGFQCLDVCDSSFQSPRLSDLIDSTHRAGRINLCANWDLVIVTSSFVCEILSPIPEEIKTGFRLPNYKNVPAALTNLIRQATIKKILHQNKKLTDVGQRLC